MGLKENPKRSAKTDCAIAAIQAICSFEIMKCMGPCFSLEPRDKDGHAIKIGQRENMYKLAYIILNEAKGFVRTVAQVCNQRFIMREENFSYQITRYDILLEQYDGDEERLETDFKDNKWAVIG